MSNEIDLETGTKIVDNDDFIFLDTVSIEDISKKFPWKLLSEEDLRNKLEIAYKKIVKNSVAFSRNVARLIRKQNSDRLRPNNMDIWESGLVLPINKEHLIAYELVPNDQELLKKRTLSHRELFFWSDDMRFELSQKIYNQKFHEDDVRGISNPVTSNTGREIIDALDLANYPKKIETRISLENEMLAMFAYAYDENKIGSKNSVPSHLDCDLEPSKIGYKGQRHYNKQFSYNKESFDVYELQHPGDQNSLNDNLRRFKNDIIQYEKMYRVDSVEKIINDGIIQMEKDRKVNKDVELTIAKKNLQFQTIAKVLQEFYPNLNSNSKYFSEATFFTEIGKSIDYGRLGFTFSVIATSLDEIPPNMYYELYDDLSENSKTKNFSVDPGLRKMFLEDLAGYRQNVTNANIAEREDETMNMRSKKDQIYKSMILSIYGIKRYNELVTFANKYKQQYIYNNVTDEEVEMIEAKHAEILKRHEIYRNNNGKHVILRKEYDTLPLESSEKHILFLQMYDAFALDSKRMTSLQRNNHEIICKFDGTNIGCEHELILAKMKQLPFAEQEFYQDRLNKEFVEIREEFDAGTCQYCGRKIEDYKQLVVTTEFDVSKQPIPKFRVSMKETKDIEYTIIRAIQKNDPVAGLIPEVQAILAVFIWDDVRRITDYVEPTIVNFYNYIENNRDSNERIYKELTKICVIYSHIVYEIMTYRPDSIKFLSTPELPWDPTKVRKGSSTSQVLKGEDVGNMGAVNVDKTETTPETSVNPEILLKRCLFMIRHRFKNQYLLSRKIRKGMMGDYLVSIYKQYIHAQKKNLIKPLDSSNRWSKIYYRKQWSDIKLDELRLISDGAKDPYYSNLAKNLLEYMGNIDFSKVPTYKSTRPRKSINLYTGFVFNEYLEIPFTYLIHTEKTKLSQILPVEYNKYGVSQKWKKIVIHTNDSKKHEFDMSRYNKLYSQYLNFYKNSLNTDIVTPDDFVLHTDTSKVTKVEYYNTSGETKDSLKKSKYSESEQSDIRNKIEIQNMIKSMFEYIEETQNVEFKKYISDNVESDPVKGYVYKPKYDDLVDEFKTAMSSTNANTSSITIRIRDDEDLVENPVKIKEHTGKPSFDHEANELITILLRSVGNSDPMIVAEKYKKLKQLGRKITQEKEELDQYVGISYFMKGLDDKEIIDIHNRYQTHKIISYITNIYQMANLLNYAESTSDLYNTDQGRTLIRYYGKLKPNIAKIDAAMHDISEDHIGLETNYINKNTSRQVQIVFSAFQKICYVMIESGAEGGQLIMDTLDEFFKQDESVNMSYRSRDYIEELEDTRRQSRYDETKLAERLIAERNDDQNEGIGGIAILNNIGEYSGNDILGKERRPIESMLQSEYQSQSKEYSNDLDNYHETLFDGND